MLPGNDSASEAAFSLGGKDITLRWCIVEGSSGQAVEVGASALANPEGFEKQRGFPLPEAVREGAGRNNAIYGNRFLNNAGLAIQYPVDEAGLADGLGPDAQRVVCGNDYDGKTHDDPEAPCPDSVPETGEIGHLGGDSPFA